MLASVVSHYLRREYQYMKSEELRAIQAPLKDRYRSQPETAKATLRATGRVGEGVTCKLDASRAEVVAGLHEMTGGDGLGLCSGDMLLEALVACAGVTFGAVSTALGFEVEDPVVSVEGDLDFRGTLGVSKDVRVGFTEIRLTFSFKSHLSEEEINRLIALTERYCVVLQTIKGSSELSVGYRRSEMPGNSANN